MGSKMKRWKSIIKGITAIALSLVTAIGLIPGANPVQPVYATDMKNMSTSPAVLATDVNTDDMQIVGYAGKEWYVIGYGSTGNTANADANGGITLFSKANLGNGSVQFNPSTNQVNTYKDSNLQDYIDNTVYGSFGDAEKAAVITRNLAGGSANSGRSGYDSNKIAGDPVDNAALWPLSVAEAQNLPSDNIRKVDDYWWLRSPGFGDNSVAAVDPFNGYVISQGFAVNGNDTARPAFYLNPASIIFTSAANGGKNPGTAGDGSLNQVGTVSVAANTEWKLTLIDTTRAGFTATRVDNGDVEAGDTIKVSFSGAGTGSGEYVSAVLVSSTATSELLYYGHIATQTAASSAAGVDVTIPAGLSGGTYILKVFSENVNTSAHTTDLASNPDSNAITLTVTASANGSASGQTTSPSGNNSNLTTGSSDSKPEEEPTYDYLDELRAKIAAAIALGGKQTVTWDQGTLLPYDIMKTLQDNPNITLVFSYRYLNKDYKVTLPGKKVKAYANIPFYGPLYLNTFYGEKGTKQTSKNRF